MSELTEFLLARIAEDEGVARAATLGHDGRPVDAFDWDYGPGSERDMTTAQDEAHRTWSPWRALAECEAKGRIVGQASNVEWGGYAVRDVILGHLAAVYADHPDYREEWRP